MRTAVKADQEVASHWRVLMSACYEGQAEVVPFFIDHGAEVSILPPTAHRYRPLHRMVEFNRTAPKTAGHTETVRLLLAAGAGRAGPPYRLRPGAP